MPNRSRSDSPKKSPILKPSRDPNVAAFDTLQEIIATAEAEGKDPLAVALGRRGGLKGGRSRADNMTEEQRIASARKAALARWGKRG